MKGSGSSVLSLLLCVVATRSAIAAVDLSGGATVGTGHDTNAYELSSIEPLPLATGGTVDRDNTTRYASAFATARSGSAGPLQLQLSGTFTHVESQGSARLDHDDYTLAGGLEWRPLQAFDVSMEASQSRLPLGLADVGGAASTPQRERHASSTLRLRPTPRWQLSLSPRWNEILTDLPAARDFRLREKSAEIALGYLGAGRLVPGLSASKAWGRNSGIENATRYQERTLQATLGYAATDVSSFTLAAGRSWRSTSLIVPTSDPGAVNLEGDNSALTGSLNFNRQLSVKTGIYASAFRYFEQYEAGVNPSVGSGFAFGANWAPTAKLAVNLDSALAWTTIEGVVDAGADGERDDLVRTYSLSIEYRATRIVSLRTHVTRRIRRSEVWTDQFNSTVAGIELTASID